MSLSAPPDETLERLRLLPQKVAEALNGTILTLPTPMLPHNPVADALHAGKRRRSRRGALFEVTVTAPATLDPGVLAEALKPVIATAFEKALHS